MKGKLKVLGVGVAALSLLAIPTPAKAATYVVPSSIADDCSRPVDVEINNWLRSIPDNSVVQFNYGKCYAQDGSILVVDKRIWTVNGNHSTFKAVTQGGSHRANWRVRRGTNVNLFNMTVIGSNVNGGITPNAYVGALEFQHGIAIESLKGGIVDNVKATNNYGDCILTQFDETVGPSSPVVEAVRLTNNRCEKTGRQGIALTHVVNVYVGGNTFSEINMNAIDIEPDTPTHYTKDITIENNSFGRTRFSVVAALGQSASPYTQNITINNNTMTAQAVTCQSPIINESPAHGQRYNWTITGNTFNTFSDGVYSVRGNTMRIENNTISYTFAGCGRDAGVRLFDSDNVQVLNNRFPGARVAVVADAASTGVTQSGNTL